MNILGIESSCDETSAAVFSDSGLKSNVIASQTIHERFGGVVPELASRAHQQRISSTVRQALEEASLTLNDIEAVAVTHGPGLMGALLVGLSFAKGIALSRRIPLIGVHHMEAHIFANFIEQPCPTFPFIALTVSGGHTQLVLGTDYFESTVIGQTRDDAAGEAFDKIGKMLGLSYPAGPQIDRLSEGGNPDFISLPQARFPGSLEFSFSGLKTAVRYWIESLGTEEEQKAYISTHLSDICASVSKAIVAPLVRKVEEAVKVHRVQTIVLSGGVSANRLLRDKMSELSKKKKWDLYYPKPVYCTDNAAMIAVTGWYKAKENRFDDLKLKPFAS